MPVTRNIIRVFLASPGDLGDERKAAKEVVDQLNATWGLYEGYQIDLIGWEDTLSQSGRPQHIINQEMNTCELFVGVMWCHWGSPPDVCGKYSSGFEEEFTLSKERRQGTGEPEIKMFFKRVEDQQLRDPGPHLQRVFGFKQRLIDEKLIKFDEFETLREFRDRLFACLSQYVQTLLAKELQAPADTSPSRGEAKKQTPSRPEEGLLTRQGAGFLERVVEKFKTPDGLSTTSSLDVARLRLLASVVWKRGNDNGTLGVHDANLIFAKRADLSLSKIELYGLIDCAIANIRSENVPLFGWLNLVDDYEDYLGFCAVGALTESEKIGAITAMRMLRVSDFGSPPPGERASRVQFILREGEAVSVKTAALRYLAQEGAPTDISSIQQEVDRSNHGTVRQAIEAVISIKLRHGYQGAFAYMAATSFDSISEPIISTVFERSVELGSPSLVAGLSHRSAQVRSHCAKELARRNQLDLDKAKVLSTDSSADVRYIAVNALKAHSPEMSDADARKILVRPETASTLGTLFGASPPRDEAGERRFEEYEREQLKGRPEADLVKYADNNWLSRSGYYVLRSQYFDKYKAQLRADIDDKYEGYFDRFMERLEATYGEKSVELVDNYRKLEMFSRRKMMRAGLDVLTDKGGAEDLPRMRAHILEGFAEFDGSEFGFLRRHGAWEDIALITRGIQQHAAGASAWLLPATNRVVRLGAEATYHLGRHRVAEQLELDLDKRVLARILLLCSESIFATVPDHVIQKLLSDRDDSVRKSTALASIRALNKKRIKKTIENHEAKDEGRYYNVLFWLDCGMVLDRNKAKMIARKIVGELLLAAN